MRDSEKEEGRGTAQEPWMEDSQDTSRSRAVSFINTHNNQEDRPYLGVRTQLDTRRLIFHL